MDNSVLLDPCTFCNGSRKLCTAGWPGAPCCGRCTHNPPVKPSVLESGYFEKPGPITEVPVDPPAIWPRHVEHDIPGMAALLFWLGVLASSALADTAIDIIKLVNGIP